MAEFINFDKLNEYKKIIVKEELSNMLKFLQNYYFDFNDYLNNVFINNGENKKYKIILAIEYDYIVGCIIVQPKHNKICTFFVSEQWRGRGIGTGLFKRAFDILGSRFPYFYFHKDSLQYYMRFVHMYRWDIKKQGDYYYINQMNHINLPISQGVKL